MTEYAVFVCKYGLCVSVLSAPVHLWLTRKLLDKIVETLLISNDLLETRPLVENKVMAKYKKS